MLALMFGAPLPAGAMRVSVGNSVRPLAIRPPVSGISPRSQMASQRPPEQFVSRYSPSVSAGFDPWGTPLSVTSTAGRHVRPVVGREDGVGLLSLRRHWILPAVPHFQFRDRPHMEGVCPFVAVAWFRPSGLPLPRRSSRRCPTSRTLRTVCRH